MYWFYIPVFTTKTYCDKLNKMSDSTKAARNLHNVCNSFIIVRECTVYTKIYWYSCSLDLNTNHVLYFNKKKQNLWIIFKYLLQKQIYNPWYRFHKCGLMTCIWVSIWPLFPRFFNGNLEPFQQYSIFRILFHFNFTSVDKMEIYF